MEDKIVKNIKTAVKSLEQKSLFGSNEDKLEEACVAYLKFKGYRAVPPKSFSVDIKNLDGLIEYFYTLSNNKHPENYMTSFNQAKDRAVARKFVDSRMNLTGCSEKHALNECGEIVKTVFDYEEEFKFKYAVGFYIFGQDNLKWITDRALQTMNGLHEEKEEQKAKRLRAKILAADEDDAGFSDLDDLLAKMEEENNA